MRPLRIWLSSVLGLCFAVVAYAPAVSAQSTGTAKEVRQFEIVSVDGNKVVVKGERGAQEITVPDDFRLTVDGKPVSVHELKPGMKGTATITTTTTSTPVFVTEVRNGEVMQRSGNSIIVRTDNGIRMFTEADATKRGVRIIRDGEPVNFSDLRQGDRLTATIVTQAAPKVMTQRQVEAAMSSPPASTAAREAPAPAAPAPAAPAPTAQTPPSAPTETAATAGRRLPQTASALPVIGLLGVALLAVGSILTVRRRRRSAV